MWHLRFGFKNVGCKCFLLRFLHLRRIHTWARALATQPGGMAATIIPHVTAKTTTKKTTTKTTKKHTVENDRDSSMNENHPWTKLTDSNNNNNSNLLFQFELNNISIARIRITRLNMKASVFQFRFNEYTITNNYYYHVCSTYCTTHHAEHQKIGWADDTERSLSPSVQLQIFFFLKKKHQC